MRTGGQGNQVRVSADYEALSAGAADCFVDWTREAIGARGGCAVGLSGGQTPRRMYELIGQAPRRDDVDWRKVQICWVDERCAPADDLRSNFRMVNAALLRHIPIPAENIHRIQGELPPETGADRYEQELRLLAGTGPPTFDLLILGVGEDGHTASLFPGSPALREQRRWAAVAGPGPEGLLRVTITLPVIRAARRAMFVVSGAAKAGIVARVINRIDAAGESLPVELARSDDAETLWILDRNAAGQLRSG